MNKTLFEFANIDNDSKIKIVTNLETKDISNDNIYVDKNPFDMVTTDPVTQMFYRLYNVYLIEDGNINTIGFKTKLYNVSDDKFTEIPTKMNAWINFIDNEVGKGIKRCKFNGGAFNQFIDNKVLFTPKDNKLYKQIIKHTTSYDRPWNITQKIMYLKGAKDAIKNKLSMKEIINISIEPEKSSTRKMPYFSFEEFYIEGMKAAWKGSLYEC